MDGTDTVDNKQYTVTKYGHACVIVSSESTQIIIDPGELTELPENLTGISAVVITHEHFDHVSVLNVSKIVEQNPQVVVYGVASALAVLQEVSMQKVIVNEDTEVSVGGTIPMLLNITDHAVVHESSPCKNLTVTISDEFYYPGDCLVPPKTPVRTTAVPLCAPWLKLEDIFRFADGLLSKQVFPSHNGMLNDAGHETFNAWLMRAFEPKGVTVHLLKNGETI